MRKGRVLAVGALAVGAIVTIMAIFESSWDRYPTAAGSHPLDTIKPIVSWIGAFSCIEKQSCFRVNTAEAWKDLWLRHTGATLATTRLVGKHVPVLPEIDFNRYMVLAIFLGKGLDSGGLRITAIGNSEDELKIRCVSDSSQGWVYGFDSIDSEARAFPKWAPYSIFVLPRISKSLIVERDRQALKDKPPVWEELSRYAPLRD